MAAINITRLERDLDLELALLLDESRDLLRLLLLCLPLSLGASTASLPSGLESSIFVCTPTRHCMKTCLQAAAVSATAESATMFYIECTDQYVLCSDIVQDKTGQCMLPRQRSIV